MKLSTKILFLIVGPFLLVTLLMMVFNATFHYKDAAAFEKDLATKQTQRLREQVSRLVNALGTRALDWGLWDDTYAYVNDGNSKYIKDNFSDPAVAFKAINVDFLCIVKRDGKIVFAHSLDDEKQKSVPLDLNLRKEFEKMTLAYFSKPQKEKSIGGLYVGPTKVALINSHVIIKSNWSGEPRGLVFVGRYIDSQMKMELSTLLQGEISFFSSENPNVRVLFDEVRDDLKDRPLLLVEESEKISSYAILNDYSGKPALGFKTEQDRFMRSAMTRVLEREAFGFLFGSVIIIALLTYGIHHYVLRRIRVLVDFYKGIQENLDLKKRINEDWNDEFSFLSEGTNKMISSIEQKQQYLIQSSKMASIGILTSGVAHEINNPLFVAKGHIQILLRKLKKDEAMKPFEGSLLQADTAMTRIEVIVRTLQQYSNAKESKVEMLDMLPLIEDALLVSHSRITKLGIDLVKDLPSEPTYVLGSSTSIQQILLNLLANAYEALEAMPLGQRFLRVSLTTKEDYLTLKITDSGPGIPAEIMPKIFDPFYTTKEVGKGTGLGLFTVHSFVQAMGGTILCESEANKGTIFKIILPYKKS